MNGFIEYSLAREIAADVYLSGDETVPFGWEIDESFNADAQAIGGPGAIEFGNGFYAYALKPSADNTSVVANTR